jgi:hypothetical protein
LLWSLPWDMMAVDLVLDLSCFGLVDIAIGSWE